MSEVLDIIGKDCITAPFCLPKVLKMSYKSEQEHYGINQHNLWM